MNIKQTKQAFAIILLLSGITTLLMPTDVFAVSEDKFASILCDDFQGPSTSGGTLADDCRKDAKDGILSKHWYDKTIKYADWKEKSAKALYNHIGKEPPIEDTDPPKDEGVDACKTKTSIIPVDCSTGGNPIWGLLLMVINILTAGIGIVAIGGVIYAAILWTTAEDKNAQIVKSKETIFNVVVGLIAFALLYAFLQFLIPGGVFNV